MTHEQSLSSRRRFLQSSASLGAAIAAPAISRRAWAGGDDSIRVGLIGCGRRGGGAALQALNADPGVHLVAMADAFPDHLERTLKNISAREKLRPRVQVPPEKRFVGFDAGKKLIESDVDVVLLAETPHFRPHHLRLAIEAGKHVFCEKPVAVDGPGVRSVLESVRIAKEKKLSVVSGLCWRYHQPKVATMERVLEGGIGDIVAMQCTYNTNELWSAARKPGWSDMEWQIRNWLYFAWLSGDHINEQHIHSLDKMVWAMHDEAPASAVASGGRQVRTAPEFGNVYDHFNVVYEWKNGVKGFASCRQINGCANDVSDHFFGTKGTCHVFKHAIEGEKPWRFKGKPNNMYQTEHDELFASIRRGEPINNGEYMAKSTLTAIMGRMAAYTGQKVSYEQALNSKERLGPASYAWGEAPAVDIAMPGITPLR